MKAQYGILRFKKYKGPAISPIEAHNERTKEQYASNPDIDVSRSRYNLHLVQPQGRYREEADRTFSANNRISYSPVDPMPIFDAHSS